MTLSVTQSGARHTRSPGLRPLALAVAIHSALLCLTASVAHAQQTDNTATTPASTDSERVDNRKLPQIDVVESREDQHKPGASVKVTKDDLEKQGASSFADVLKYQPLVTVPGLSAGTDNSSTFDHPGSGSYNIRGVDGNRIGVDVDDVEMPEAVSRAATSSEGRSANNANGQGRDFIDPEMYSEVQVDSGTTTAARPAGGIGGSVSFRTKSPEDYVSNDKPYYAGVKAGYNSANRSWGEAVTGAAKSGDLEGLIVYSHRDGHETENNSKVINAYPATWSSDAVLLKGGLRINAQNKLTVSADIFRRTYDTNYTYWNSQGTAVAGTAVQHSTTARDTFQLGHLWTPANALLDKLETKLSYQDTDMSDATVQTTTAGVVTYPYSRNTNRQLSLSTTATKQWGNNRIRLGLNASENKNDHVLNGVANTGQPYPNTKTTKYGGFIDDEITFDIAGHRLAVLPGLRVDRTRSSTDFDGFNNAYVNQGTLQSYYGSGYTNTIVSPSLSLVFDIVPKLSAYAQWKHGGRAPSTSETYGAWSSGYTGPGAYILIGNPSLKQETSDAFDLGLKGEPVDGLTFKSSVFYTRYKNFIDYERYTYANNPSMFTGIDTSLYSVLYQAQNRDKAYIYGLELSARVDHGKFIPALQGTYTNWALGLSQGRSKSEIAGDTYQDLASVAPAKAVVSFGYDAPEQLWGGKFTATAVKSKQAVYTTRASYSTTITSSTTTYYKVPGYTAFDLTGYWRPARNVRINAGINNLFDKTYWNYADVSLLTPSLAQDQQDIQLKTASGRTFFVSASMDF